MKGPLGFKGSESRCGPRGPIRHRGYKRKRKKLDTSSQIVSSNSAGGKREAHLWAIRSARKQRIFESSRASRMNKFGGSGSRLTVKRQHNMEDMEKTRAEGREPLKTRMIQPGRWKLVRRLHRAYCGQFLVPENASQSQKGGR